LRASIARPGFSLRSQSHLPTPPKACAPMSAIRFPAATGALVPHCRRLPRQPGNAGGKILPAAIQQRRPNRAQRHLRKSSAEWSSGEFCRIQTGDDILGASGGNDTGLLRLRSALRRISNHNKSHLCRRELDSVGSTINKTTSRSNARD
jgi:hypothetical protein